MAENIPYAKADKPLFEIPTIHDNLIDLYMDDFIGVCLDRVKNGIYEATTYFNVVINTFDLFFSAVVDRLPNGLKRKVALSLRKLKGEGTPAEVKKTLG